jgi:glutathione synthase/RimK-type ligase-like ATP-grasp enzyme
MHVCLLGDIDDITTTYIGWIARQSGYTVLKLSEGALGIAWEYMLDDFGRGKLRVGDTEWRWEKVTGVFVRLDPDPPLPRGVTLEEKFRNGFVLERREGLHQLLEHLQCTVINRPSAGRSNASKPYQMTELEMAGFDVPRWIASNSADAVCAFTRECRGHAIYKASSGLRSRVRRVDAQLIDLHVGSTPTVVQEYVPGTDVRVHTVRSDTFACAVTSQSVDYRFEHHDAHYEKTSIPEELAERCCAFAAAAGLVLAGFDFRRTPEGRYFCLEMNPVPSFLPYEIPAGLPIGAAVVEALRGGH